MAIIENGKAVLADQSGQLKMVPADQAADAVKRFGWSEATPEQIAEYDRLKDTKAAPVAGRGLAAGSAALGTGAVLASEVSRFAGEVDAMGNPIDTVAPVSPQAIAPAAFSEEATLAQEVYPGSAAVGAAAPAVLAGIAAAPIGGAGIPGLLATEGLLGGVLGEAGSAAVEGGRPMSAQGAMLNGAIGIGLAGLGAGGVAAYKRLFKPGVDALSETVAKVAQRRLPRALAGGDDLSDAAVAEQARGVVQARTAETIDRIDEALDAARPPVSNNPEAQKEALRGAAEAMDLRSPELASQLASLVKMPRQERYRALLRIRTEHPDGQALINDLISDASLWGDKAVAQGNAILGAKAARSSGPGALRDALQSIDDPAVRKLSNQLAQHVDDAGGVEAAQAFAPRRSVGAAGDGPETMPAEQVQYLIQNDDKVVDHMRTVAGGGEGEQGAFQDFNESFRGVTNNRVKRQDFAAAAPVDEATRAALVEERNAIAESLNGVIGVLKKRGAGNKVAMLQEHALQIRMAPVEEIAGALDRAKQTLDDLHMRAIIDPNDQYGEVLSKIDPVVERVRGTLENPAYVGDKIAELQQVRNDAWSNKDSGFIRNMKIANETGVKLFKRLERDYHTGDLVMQFDPGAFKSLLSLDWHESKPVLEAWSKVLDSAERMAANTAEVGAQSAGKSPLGRLQKSIDEIRWIFDAQSKRLAARDLAEPGRALLARAEKLPGVGTAVRGAKGVLGEQRVEALAARAGAKHVPVRARTASESLDELRNLGAPKMRVPEQPGQAARGAGTAVRADASTGGSRVLSDPEVAKRAREILARRRGQAGHIDLGPAQTIKASKAADDALGGGALAQKLPENLPPIPADDVFSRHAESLAQHGVLAERLSGPGGKTPGGFFRGKDGTIRYIKIDKDPAHSYVESGNTRMYQALGADVPELKVIDLGDGQVAVGSDYLGGDFKELDQIEDWSTLSPEVKTGYAKLLPIDVIMGNWDVGRNARNIMTDGKRVVMIDAGEAASNVWGAKWFQGPIGTKAGANETHTARYLSQAKNIAEGVPVSDVIVNVKTGAPDIVGRGAPHELLQGFGKGELRKTLQQSFDEVTGKIAAAGGPEKFVKAHQPTLTPAEVKKAGAEMGERIRKMGQAIPYFAGLLAVGFGASEASAAEPAQDPAEIEQAQMVAEHARVANELEADAQTDLENTARAMSDPDYAARWTRQARELPGTLEEFQGVHATPQQAYFERRDAVLAMARDPSALADKLAESYGSLPPQLRDQLGAKAFEVAQYLKNALPPSRGVSVSRPKGLPPSSIEIRTFALKYMTATDPSTAFDDAKRGILRHEQVATLRDLWRPRYEELRSQTLVSMGAGRASVIQRQRADLLFGYGSALDPAFSRRLTVAAAAEYAKQEQGGPGGAPGTTKVPGATNPGGLNALQLGASAPLPQ